LRPARLYHHVRLPCCIKPARLRLANFPLQDIHVVYEAGASCPDIFMVLYDRCPAHGLCSRDAKRVLDRDANSLLCDRSVASFPGEWPTIRMVSSIHGSYSSSSSA
jgi:hypothetical protein